MKARWRLGRRTGLDGIRGIAVLLVVLSHAGVPGLRGGASGVTMFFVLSGFLITTLLLEEAEATGHIVRRAFYMRRALRLLPALVAVVFVACTFETARYLAGDSSGAALLPRAVVGALFFVANWFHVAGKPLGILDHTWSLAVEEQFYLVWPTAILLLGPLWRRRPRVLVALLLAAAAASAAERFLLWDGLPSANRIYFATDARADALLIGCALAVVLTRIREVRVPGWLLVPAALAIAVASGASGQRFNLLWNPVLAATGGLILVAYVATRRRAGVLEWRPLVVTGRISYGLYLWHFPLIGMIDATFGPQEHGPGIIFLLVVPWLVAYASYRVLERPFLARKGRWTPGRGDAGSEPAPQPELAAV